MATKPVVKRARRMTYDSRVMAGELLTWCAKGLLWVTNTSLSPSPGPPPRGSIGQCPRTAKI